MRNSDNRIICPKFNYLAQYIPRKAIVRVVNLGKPSFELRATFLAMSPFPDLRCDPEQAHIRAPPSRRRRAIIRLTVGDSLQILADHPRRKRAKLPSNLLSELQSASVKVVVAGVTVQPFCTEAFTMLVLNIVILLVTVGFLCWLVFSLAVHALPLLAGVTAGLWAYEAGTGTVGGFLIGAAAAGSVAIFGQLLFAFARPLWVRVIVAGLFACPAVVAGYAATLGIARLVIPSETWQMALATIGAVAVGSTALFRMAGVAPPDPRTEMASEA